MSKTWFALSWAAALAVGAQDQEKKQDPGDKREESYRSEPLRQVRKAVDDWSARSWDQALAEDVSLALRKSEMVRQADGTSTLVSFRTVVQGKDKVTRALEKLNEDYAGRIKVTSELLSGRQAVLFGEVRASGSETPKPADGEAPSPEGKSPEESFPFAIQLRFDDQGKIDRMVISSFDLKAEPSPEQK